MTKSQAFILLLLSLTVLSNFRLGAEDTQKDIGVTKAVDKISAEVDLKHLKLIPFADLKDKTLFRDNADVLDEEVRKNKVAISQQQFEHYCGTPDGITVDGIVTMTAYFYERDGDKKSWVMYAFFKDGKLDHIGYNDASVNDNSILRKLRPEKFPKDNKPRHDNR